MIKGVRDHQNNWVEEIEDIAGVATEYFENIFKSGSCDRMEECLSAVQHKVTLEMQEVLSREYSAEEVKNGIIPNGANKSTGTRWYECSFLSEILACDNVLVAYETLHSMHCKKSGKKGFLALKLDISKAYDRIEWNFLRNIMLRLGFPKQGDPLSPYLFLLCAEGFTALLDRAKEEGRLHGVSICWRAPTISHLLFADDSLLFCQANQDDVRCISDALQLFAAASGQCINFEKSSFFFSNNMKDEVREQIKRELRVKEVERFESYLGLPTLVGRVKYQTFSFLKDRVWKKIQSWKGKLLSRVVKEVLIKVVAQSIPTYTMGVFLLPVKLCNEFNAMYVRFWWGQVGDEKKIYWKSWSALSKPKKEGGMGFRDLRNFNLAMLAKQG
ncbi:uncharacterized protein LOC115950404 [Quercus lobata]|uniref:uncharacterized protein LOC115950404 n=1 Tax=Quercus lobata TaxID=97700 RepID=UPI0012440F73|nr:uncharacterized protein LOC115950404 [Quercus lobata]